MKNKIMVNKNNRFEGIDGLKAYAIIGIAIMHVLSNGANYIKFKYFL